MTNSVLGSQDRAPWRWVPIATGPIVIIDASLGFHFRVTLTENSVLEPPRNAAPGQPIILRVEQNEVGGWTLTPNSALVFRNGETGLGIDTTAGAVSFVSLRYDDVAKVCEVATSLTKAHADVLYDAAGAAAAAAATSQPLDADLTAIAALTTTTYGRGFLPLANITAAQTYIGATAAGAAVLTAADAAAQRTALALAAMAVVADAPSDGSTYGRNNAAWAVVSGSGSNGTLATPTASFVQPANYSIVVSDEYEITSALEVELDATGCLEVIP